MTKNKGKQWTDLEVSKLKSLAKSNTNTEKIAKNLGRTVSAIYTKASQEEISLKPNN